MSIPVKRGMIIRHQNRVYAIADLQERHTGKMKPTVHVTLRDVRDGRQVERTLDELGAVQEVAHAIRPMQYLYAKGAQFIFMDSETFEESSLSAAQLLGGEPFLREGDEYRVMFVDGQPMMLMLPEGVALKVASTAAPSHSVGTAGSVLKEATLENGLVIRVPLFIKIGDAIRVDTRTKTYMGKE